MGSIRVGGNVKPIVVKDGIDKWETTLRKEIEQGIGQGEKVVVAIYDADGNPVTGFIGNRGDEYVNISRRSMKVPDATFTILHTNDTFGGTMPLSELKVFSKSAWNKMDATTKQGMLYSIQADKVDKNGRNYTDAELAQNKKKLESWVNSKSSILNKNFKRSYDKTLKDAMTPLKSGPNKGMVKITVDGKTVYRKPMTEKQANAFALRKSFKMLENTYSKNLKDLGFTYKAKKGVKLGG